jgi:hypothetical protein
MATKKKSSSKGATVAAPARTKDSWASTIKQALQKKQATQGWPTEATGKSHAKQSAAHARLGRKNPPTK